MCATNSLALRRVARASPQSSALIEGSEKSTGTRIFLNGIIGSPLNTFGEPAHFPQEANASYSDICTPLSGRSQTAGESKSTERAVAGIKQGWSRQFDRAWKSFDFVHFGLLA